MALQELIMPVRPAPFHQSLDRFGRTGLCREHIKIVDGMARRELRHLAPIHIAFPLASLVHARELLGAAQHFLQLVIFDSYDRRQQLHPVRTPLS